MLPLIRKHGKYKLKQEMEELNNKFQEQLTIKYYKLKLKEDYKKYCNRIQSLEKQDIIYILTNNVGIKE